MLEFNEETHEYKLDGVRIPSVTEVIAPIHGGYAEINKSILDAAKARGTAVHELAEAIDYGLSPDIEPCLAGYAKAYTDFLRDYRPVWHIIEGTVCSERHRYAGIVDRYGIIDGHTCVVDIKTTAQPTAEDKAAVTLQTNAYDMALKDMKGLLTERHYALYIKPDGNYRLLNCDGAMQESEAKWCFLTMLMAYFCAESAKKKYRKRERK